MATYTEAFQKIEALKRLPIGWDYGRDGPAALAAPTNALSAAFMLSRYGVSEFDVVPGINGGIIIIGYKGDEIIEIQARPDGYFDFILEGGEAESEPIVGATIADIAAKLEECGWQSLRLFVSCTRGGIYRDSDGIPVLHSAVRPMVVVYQSLAPTAWPQAELKSARTSGSFTTRKHPVSPRYSGEYQQIDSRKALA